MAEIKFCVVVSRVDSLGKGTRIEAMSDDRRVGALMRRKTRMMRAVEWEERHQSLGCLILKTYTCCLGTAWAIF